MKRWGFSASFMNYLCIRKNLGGLSDQRTSTEEKQKRGSFPQLLRYSSVAGLPPLRSGYPFCGFLLKNPIDCGACDQLHSSSLELGENSSHRMPTYFPNDGLVVVQALDGG